MARYVQGTVGNPAAGVELSDIPNYGDSFRLLTLRATLATSATVATRYPHFQFVTPSGVVVHETVGQNGQAASLTYVYDLVGGSGSANEGSAPNDSVVSLPLPDIWFPAGTKVRTLTTALAAGDQWESVFWSALVGDEWEHLHLLSQIAAQLGA